MKKRTIIALIAAAALLLSGGMLLVFGLSFAGEANYVESALASQEAILTEAFDSVKINTRDCDVKFVPYHGDADSQVTVTGMPESVTHSIVVEDGALRIDMIDEREWTDYIGIFHGFGRTGAMEMTVYLPAAEYESLQVRTDTGDITVGQELAFRKAVLRTDTGDISCVTGVSGELLDCITSTGDISVQHSVHNVMKLQSGTGAIKLGVVAADEVHLKTNTGEVDGQNVKVKMFTCSSETGDVELKDVVAENYLQVFTETGDVEIEGCDAGAVNIETDTGDVEGHFLTSKWFRAHSDTGRVRVPDTREGGECRIETNTGNINFQ